MARIPVGAQYLAGPCRAEYMLAVKDLAEMQALNRAIDKKAANMMYGPLEIEKPGGDISGGDNKLAVHIDRSTRGQWPKSGPWPWIALIVAILTAAGIWYLVSHPTPKETLNPGSSKIGISVQ